MVKILPLRVAFVHPDLGIGGAERLVLDVATALDLQGMQVEFHTNHFDKSHAFQELKENKYPITVYGDWLPRSIFGIFLAFCSYIRMLYLALFFYVRLLRDEKPDLFFVDQIPMSIPILRWSGSKIIYYCHHPDLLSSRPGGSLKKFYRFGIDWLEMYCIKYADIILVNSEYTETIFKKTFPQIKQGTKILYPTISASFLEDISKAIKKPIGGLVKELNGKDVNFVFLSLNRFHPAKEIELAIHSMIQLRKKLPEEIWIKVILVIAGGFDPESTINSVYYKKLLTITEKNDLKKNIFFLKSPTDKLKVDLLKSSDCLLYTPTNEHFGIVPLEGMIASKPVIAVDSGGPKETVEHEVTGFLSEADARTFSEYMLKIMEPILKREMGSKGWKRAREQFSYDNFCSNCTDVITESLATKSN